MNYIKVQGHKNFLRDSSTNSIINVDKSEYEQYIMNRDSKSKENQKIQDLETKVASICDDLNDIKSLLRRLLDGNGS